MHNKVLFAAIAAVSLGLTVASGAGAATKKKKARAATTSSAASARTQRVASRSTAAAPAGGAERTANSARGALPSVAPEVGTSTVGGINLGGSEIFYQTDTLRVVLKNLALEVRKYWASNATRKNLEQSENSIFVKTALKEKKVPVSDPWGNEIDLGGNGYITLKVKKLNMAKCLYIKNSIEGGQYPTQANSIGSTDVITEGGCQDSDENIVTFYYKQNG